MTDQLIKLNSLQLNQKNIWVNPRDSDDFSYSDGVDEEQYLVDVLTQTENLQVNSVDLKKACRDWVAEYHLGSVRANLLADINFPDQAKVLEVGCGCGAITRYIGEQGMFVDAIEGSPARAEIAQLRNRDLDDIRIIQHNFNTLELPRKHYDVILYVGVLEYANRFINDANSTSEQAVVALLKKASASLAEDGIIVIAIENRTGYKYECGAYEDHLAKPGVGINDYTGYEFTGIKTYDSKQWKNLINLSGLKHRLYYPFGDYKFPTMTIQGEVHSDALGYLASQIHSKDMISDWQMPNQESQHWIESMRAKQLDTSTNSFGLILAKDPQSLENVFSNPWSIYDDANIAPELRLTIVEGNSNYSLSNKGISHLFNSLPNIHNAITNQWRHQLFVNLNLDCLASLITQLQNSIQSKWPSTYLVDYDQLFESSVNNKVIFGKYWDMNREITVTQQLFHFLCGFILNNTKLLSSSNSFKYERLTDIIKQCCENTEVFLEDSIDELIKFEQTYRNQTYHYPGSVKNDLDFIISTHNKFKFKHINSQLFFATDQNGFQPQNSQIKRTKQTDNLQTQLFSNLDHNYRYLRFDPSDHEYGLGHYLHLHSMTVNNITDRTTNILNNNSLIFSDLKLIDESKSIFRVTGIDPQIKFSLPSKISGNTGRYNLDIQLQWLGV